MVLVTENLCDKLFKGKSIIYNTPLRWSIGNRTNAIHGFPYNYELENLRFDRIERRLKI